MGKGKGGKDPDVGMGKKDGMYTDVGKKGGKYTPVHDDPHRSQVRRTKRLASSRLQASKIGRKTPKGCVWGEVHALTLYT